MGLYRQSGSKIWWIGVSHKGRRVRKSTGTTDKRLAEAIRAKAKTRLVEGTWFDIDESKLRTLKEMIEKYLSERSTTKSPASYKRDVSCFKHIINHFNDCVLADITPSKINDYKQARLAVADPQTVVKELSVLRNAFNVAIKEWEWCKDNAVSKVSMPKVPQGRVRFLTVQDIQNLLAHAEEWFKPVMLFAIHTGFREGDIITLTWEQVDFFKRRIILDKTKNDEHHTVPINDTLFEVLKNLNKVMLIDCNLVFHHNGKPLYRIQIHRALKKACERAKIADFRFHDLRHTFATLLINEGVDLYTVQKLLGHKDGRMTQRYAHLTHEKFVSAVNQLDRISHNSVIVNEGKKCGITVNA